MTTFLNKAEQAHPEKLASENWGLYFHGTGQTFEAFDEAKIGMGQDANCGLGVFTTDQPWNGARYAKMVAKMPGEGRVLLVLLNETSNYEFDNFESFYGAEWAGTGSPRHTRKHFERLRKKLSKEYTAAWFTLDDDGLIGIALRLDNIAIVGSVSCEVANALQDDELFNCPNHTAPTFKRKLLARVQELADEADLAALVAA